MKLIPLLDNIIVREIKEQNQTESGILLPTSAEEKPVLAQVVAISKGGKIDGEQVEILVSPGDKVIFPKFAGSEYKANGETLIIIKQADILAKVED